MVTVLFAKDAYITGLDRNFNFKAQHILQEAEVYEKVRRYPSLCCKESSGSRGTKSGKTAPMPLSLGVVDINREYESVVP
jgi:hypothetical protein